MAESQICEPANYVSQINIETGKVINAFQQYKVSKVFQKLYFFSLKLLSNNLKLHSLKSQRLLVSQPKNIYIKLQENMKNKQNSLDELAILLQHQEKQNKINIPQIFVHLQTYLISVLQFVENVIEMCKILSCGEDFAYQSVLSKCGRFLIDLHPNIKINKILKNIFEPIEQFDPFLFKLKMINQKQQSQPELFHHNKELKERIIKANEEINKTFKSFFPKKQLTMDISGLKNVLKKYSLDDTPRKKSLSRRLFKSRRSLPINSESLQGRSTQQKVDQIKKGIFLNFRKKKFKNNLAKSLDIIHSQGNKKSSQSLSKSINHFNVESANEFRVKKNKMTKRINFKAIQLQPLSNRSQKLNQSLQQENIPKVQFSNKTKRIQQFKLIMNNLHRIDHFSDRTESSLKPQNTYDNINDTLNTQNSERPSIKNISSPIFKRKYRKFQPSFSFSTEKYNQKSSIEKYSSSINLTQKIFIKKFQQFTERKTCQITKFQINDCTKQEESFEKQQETPSNKRIKNKVTEVQHQPLTDGISNFLQIQQSQTPQPSSDIPQPQNKTKIEQMTLPNKQKRQVEGSNHDNDRKKILLKAPRLKSQQVSGYLQAYKIKADQNLLSEISRHQHYINQFYLNKEIFCIIIFSLSLNLQTLQIKLIHQVKSEVKSQELDEDIRKKLRKMMMRNYVGVLSKSSRNIRQIKLTSQDSSFNWLLQSDFIYEGQCFVYNLIERQNNGVDQLCKQFLSANISILKVKQSVNESFLYSDQISTFKNGKYDFNEMVFSQQKIEGLPLEFNEQFKTIYQANEFLESKQIDTFDSNQDFDQMISKLKQDEQNPIKLKMFNFNHLLNGSFIVSGGWISTNSSVVFKNKNQSICQFVSNVGDEIYFGRGFEHIGTMKNKIHHFKAGLNFRKNQNKPQSVTTKIRMFSKQIYGLIKQQNGQANYGNWEINFHFKHQFIGKFNYTIDTQQKDGQQIFGNTTFFVNIYHKNQFLMGWQVEDNDFLY